MQIKFEQLSSHLQKTLASIYFVSSTENVLAEETLQRIRNACQLQGYQQHQKFTVEADFNWQTWLLSTQNLSLFSEKTILELRISGNKLTETAKKILTAYHAKIPMDKILLIYTDKLEKKFQQSAWFLSFIRNAIFIERPLLQAFQLIHWIQQHLQDAELTADSSGIQLLIELTQGNLTATQQAIEKLSLFYGKATLTAEDILQVVTESARFDLFQWIDQVLLGHIPKTLMILQYLKNDGVEATLLLWALTRELRFLIQLQILQQQGQSVEKALAQMQVWEKRKIFYKKALIRHSISTCYTLLAEAAHIDQMIKGAIPGNAWQALEELATALAGFNILHEQSTA